MTLSIPDQDYFGNASWLWAYLIKVISVINELCHFYKVSFIKTGLMFHKYHLLNQFQVFMRYKKLPIWALISLKQPSSWVEKIYVKTSFNIPLKEKYIPLLFPAHIIWTMHMIPRADPMIECIRYNCPMFSQ
jgi:hypothetical protein